jgi:DNA invertase Pin-like site-specific DNA recombinase
MTTVGYLWVGPLEHNADFQRDLLRRRGVDRLFEDISAHTSTPIRTQLTAALEEVEARDTLVVWRLDRLGSTMSGVLALLELLGRRRVGVRSVSEGLDTSGDDGAALLTIIAAFTELDRQLSRERTMAGVYAARARGRVGGRPRALSPTNVERVLMLKEQGATVREIAQEMGTSRATVYRVLEGSNVQPDLEEPAPGITLRLPAGVDLEGDPLTASE